MNKLFINAIISEIITLKEDSVQQINVQLKDAKKKIKENKLLLEYGEILDKLMEEKKVPPQKINKFLNKKYKDGKVKDYLIIEKDSEGGYNPIIKEDEEYFNVENVFFVNSSILQKITLSQKSPIINLITLYEKFLRQLIYFDCKDDYFKIIEKETVTLSSLLKFNFNKEETINYIQEQYCKDKLRGENKRISKIVALLEIDCNDESELLLEFDEIYFRRNIYVHSLQNITDDYKSLPEKITNQWISTSGDLINNPKYFHHAFRICTKTIMLLLIKYCLFKKQSKNDLETIEDLVYNKFFNKDSSDIALFCYKQLKKLSWISPTERYVYFVNYMICLKRLNHPDFKTELDKWKTDTDSDMFKLAKKLISNDYTNINLLINKLLKNREVKIDDENQLSSLSLEQINEWPLFEEYVKTKYYQELINSNNKEL